MSGRVTKQDLGRLGGPLGGHGQDRRARDVRPPAWPSESPLVMDFSKMAVEAAHSERASSLVASHKLATVLVPINEPLSRDPCKA